MNPITDIGWNCEQALVEILSTNPVLAALGVIHEDADKDVTVTRIVIQAMHVQPEAPNPRNPALNVRKVSMTCMIRQSLGTGTANDLYSTFGTLCQIIENLNSPQYGALPGMSAFLYLQPTVALENEREKSDNRRKMIKTIDFLAILKNQT